MCGRFTLTTPHDALAEAFGLEEVPALQPHYNIAPGQDIAAVGRRDAAHGPRLALLYWGFPRAATAAGAPSSGILINARSESAHRLPAFRESLRLRRCLVPADGFFEWRKTDGGKQPYYVTRADGAPFAFGALWTRAAAPTPRTSCVILTTEPNELLRGIHDRMPVIVAPESYAAWLDPECTSPQDLQALLRPFPAGALRARPVSTWVNDARHDDPRCLEPA